MIQVEGLTKDYGSRRAIDHVSFTAQKGEVLGFLGPNGAGKTTTMRILAGYMPPTSGNAQVAGFDVVENSLQVRQRVGYMPETIPLYNDMTVFAYLKYMADLRQLPKAGQRVREVIERVHMEQRADGYISNLSKGMRQRVGLAQALVHQPEVLMLDEPTIGLDPVQIIDVRNLIRELGRERTVLLSTHILSEAQQVCDRVLIIDNGRIIAGDTPDRLRARLLGSQRVEVHVSTDQLGLEQLLMSVPGVMHVEVVGEGKYEFEIRPDIDARPQAARAILDAGIDLYEMKSVGLSLEEIYIQLTQDEQDLGRTR
jgi:ABC-2 type transport system ATP-binding protein